MLDFEIQGHLEIKSKKQHSLNEAENQLCYSVIVKQTIEILPFSKCHDAKCFICI